MYATKEREKNYYIKKRGKSTIYIYIYIDKNILPVN